MDPRRSSHIAVTIVLIGLILWLFKGFILIKERHFYTLEWILNAFYSWLLFIFLLIFSFITRFRASEFERGGKFSPKILRIIFIFLCFLILKISWLSSRILDWCLSQPGFEPSFGNLAYLATLKSSDRTKQVCLRMSIYIHIYVSTWSLHHSQDLIQCLFLNWVQLALSQFSFYTVA